MNPVNPPCWTFRGTRKIVIHNCCSESVRTSTRKYPKHWFTTWVAKAHIPMAGILSWASNAGRSTMAKWYSCSMFFLIPFDRLIFPESIFRWHSSYVVSTARSANRFEGQDRVVIWKPSSLKSIKNTSHVKGSQPETANTNWSNLSGCRCHFTWIRNCWKTMDSWPGIWVITLFGSPASHRLWLG